jgi:hypothetical protein
VCCFFLCYVHTYNARYVQEGIHFTFYTAHISQFVYLCSLLLAGSSVSDYDEHVRAEKSPHSGCMFTCYVFSKQAHIHTDTSPSFPSQWWLSTKTLELRLKGLAAMETASWMEISGWKPYIFLLEAKIGTGRATATHARRSTVSNERATEKWGYCSIVYVCVEIDIDTGCGDFSNESSVARSSMNAFSS